MILAGLSGENAAMADHFMHSPGTQTGLFLNGDLKNRREVRHLSKANLREVPFGLYV